MNINLPDEYYAQLWDGMDWVRAEQKLSELQELLSLAAQRRNGSEVERLQKQIVRDLDIRCLAVRHVVASTMSPGVDRVKWRTSAEKMRAAMSLSSKDYHASPLRQIKIIAKNTGKERYPRIPTYYDRAMNVLYGYSLIPVTEALAERKSFAFRPGRSTQDAHAYVMEALKGSDAPTRVLCGDILGCYAHIQHKWLMEHVPMDKAVLFEFLNAGIVFAGELFPAEDEGISEGSNISPYLANFSLDGLQKRIYYDLHGTVWPDDFKDGNLIRFADDILVTVRTQEEGERVREIISDFLLERGLSLSDEKTCIRTVDEGFTFLSRTYYRKNGLIYSRPSDAAVERFIEELKTLIENNTKSQRELILTLNRKLKGWAGYHRYSAATDAFRKVDAAVQAALLEMEIAQHPRMPLAKIQAKYWYKEGNGHYCYALPDDKSVRVVRLADTLLLTHYKVRTNVNPFVDRDYIEERTHARDKQNVTGAYRSVWERQNGICYYCGRPILTDQPKDVIQIDVRRAPSIRNSAYIHRMCIENEFEIVRTMEPISTLRPYDVYQALEGIAAGDPPKRVKGSIRPSWKHFKLKQYFSNCTAASITLTFSQIEEIEGAELPASARKNKDWWYPCERYNKIAEAWITEGYSLKKLDMKKQKVTLRRNDDGVSNLVIPSVLLHGKLPDNAVFELETHMDYVIKKYGLMKKGNDNP